MKRLIPMFLYFGSKHKLAKKYDAPLYNTIIEPFAGGAAYSTLHFDKKIILFEVHQPVIEAWNFIIKVKKSEFLALPCPIEHGTSLLEHKIFRDCPEACSFVGFNMGRGMSKPRMTPDTWKCKRTEREKAYNWTKARQHQMANQLECFRHWKIYPHGYETIGSNNMESVWYIDPPYNDKCSNKYHHHKIDFKHLREWCRSRQGQVMVCEKEGATWINNAGDNFKFFSKHTGRLKTAYNEVVWRQGCWPRDEDIADIT